MDNKKIIVIIVLGIFIVGGLGMMFLGKGKNTSAGNVVKNSNRQQGESQDEMMARMHPNQPSSNDVSSHHS